MGKKSIFGQISYFIFSFILFNGVVAGAVTTEQIQQKQRECENLRNIVESGNGDVKDKKGLIICNSDLEQLNASFKQEQSQKEEDLKDNFWNQSRSQSNVANQNSSESFGQQCISETNKAIDSCDFRKNKDTQMAIGMANQMNGQIKAMSMSSPALMCSKMTSITQAIDAAIGSFSVYCSSAYSDCDNACDVDIAQLDSTINSQQKLLEASSGNPQQAEQIKQYIGKLENRMSELKTADRKCSKLSGNINNIMQTVGSFATMEAAKSQYCGAKTDALAELCKAQPSNALCAAKAGNSDCSNPTVAASNLTCICQANRNDPRCTALSKTGLSSGFNNTNTSSGSDAGSADAAAGDFGGLGGGEFGGSEPVNMNAGNDGGVGLPGQKGGGRGGGLDMGGGQGGSGKPGANNRGNEGEGLNTKILSGYGVGGSGSSGSRSGGYGGTVGGTYPSYNSRGYVAGNKPGQQPVDLRKFLPGGQMDPSRGLAGVSGPDGITGPNTDIWKKVKSRYFNLQPSLLP